MHRFLVVDDSATIRLAMTHALQQSAPHCEVSEAASAKDAIVSFEKGEFDAVFLDMALGADSGLSVLSQMLATKPSAKVFLCTGLEREHPDVVSAISDGAFGYVRKPVRVEGIRKALKEAANEDSPLGRIG